MRPFSAKHKIPSEKKNETKVSNYFCSTHFDLSGNNLSTYLFTKLRPTYKDFFLRTYI